MMVSLSARREKNGWAGLFGWYYEADRERVAGHRRYLWTPPRAPAQDPHHPNPLLPSPSPRPGEEGAKQERPRSTPLPVRGVGRGRERGRGEGLFGRGLSEAT